MKTKFTYLLIFFLILDALHAQLKQFNLSNGNCQLFNGSIYCFGINAQKQNTHFSLYVLDLQLKIKDSLQTDLGRPTTDSYLQTYSDTLHGFLNIYLQKKEKKTVTILRFNKKSELVATITNVDIARLNNTSLFSNDMLYFKNDAYSVKTVQDTSGKQFYLNKYSLKSETQNFDYELKWQFPFERRNIHSAHIFFANKFYALLYVTVNDGPRKGQWLLKIDAESGKLIKAIKLNDKGETSSYQFGSFWVDETSRSIYMAGQKFTEAQFNLSENKLSLANAPFVSFYYLEMDSLGEMLSKQEFKIPVNDVKTATSGAKKAQNGYILRFTDLVKKPEGAISLTCDIFKSANNSLCVSYANTALINLVQGEGKLTLEKNIISPNLLIEQYYVTQDKLDLNGKLCADSLSQFEKLFYKPLTLAVKQQFKIDGEKNPVWIITKHTSKKNMVNFSFLRPVKKIYQVGTIEEINETSKPVFTTLTSENFIISTQPEEGKYQVKLYNW